MDLDKLKCKLEIIDTLFRVGFAKEIISLVLYKIEYFKEDLGEALWKSLLAIEENKKSDLK